MNRSLLSIIDQALAQGVAGSISLCLGSESLGPQAHSFQRGHTSTAPHQATDQNSIYDLASLTKIIGTGLAVAKAVDEGFMSLDEHPFKAWPHISIRHLLAHSSGLAAHIKFYAEPGTSLFKISHNRSNIFNALFKQKPQAPVGVRLYSDLNFLALGFLLEQRLAKPLIEIFRDTWERLNLAVEFSYFPSKIEPQKLSCIAPTGYCEWRKARIRAQVNDLNCYFLGGIAGHAGLFGTLSSVATLGNFLLRCMRHPANSLEALIAHFAASGLAFAKPEAKGSVRMLSPKSFGHFGFTGTSLWIDPALLGGQGLVITLLSNRVDRSLCPEGIFWLRQRIHQTVSRAQFWL